MADGEATLPELFCSLIFESSGLPHQRGRRVGVDRHLAMRVWRLSGERKRKRDKRNRKLCIQHRLSQQPAWSMHSPAPTTRPE